MAEYYPLLARAVAGMRNAPAEQRRAIYDRARQALLGQLRSMQPPVPEESITRESTALDEAIARVEAELAVPVPTPASETPSPASPPRTPVAESPASAAPAEIPPEAVPEPVERQPVAADTPPGAESLPPPNVPAADPVIALPPPVAAPPSRIVTAPTVAMPPRAAPLRPAADALTRIVAERGPPLIRAAQPQDEASESDTARGVLPLPSAPRLHVPSFADAMAAADGTAGDAGTIADEPAAIESSRQESLRPPAPRPISTERFNSRALILASVALLVVAGIAYAAWRLRDRPETLARSQAALLAARQAAQQNPAKIATRADGGGGTAASTDTGPAVTPDAAAPAPSPAPGATVGGTMAVPAAPTTDAAPAATEVPAAPVAATPEPATPIASAPATAPTSPATSAIGVSQRAAFLVDAPEDPAKVKTYVGTVLWSTENASPGQDQPIARTVRAEVEVPEAGIRLAMVFQKNYEAQFPASHTLELRFTLSANNPLGAIKQINVPQMRKDDSPAGDALAGLPVTITDNYFLVGLSRGDATARNLDLIKSRNWFDVPLLLTSGKVAKITFEKGATGQQAIDDVLQSWQ